MSSRNILGWAFISVVPFVAANGSWESTSNQLTSRILLYSQQHSVALHDRCPVQQLSDDNLDLVPSSSSSYAVERASTSCSRTKLTWNLVTNEGAKNPSVGPLQQPMGVEDQFLNLFNGLMIAIRLCNQEMLNVHLQSSGTTNGFKNQFVVSINYVSLAHVSNKNDYVPVCLSDHINFVHP